MFDENSDRYVEFGVESMDPEDDFGWWVTEKKRQQDSKRLAQVVKQGLVNIEK
ncbi:MAG: hypothetical protein AB1646_14660 [Thermodesulfobacteriota bacterium]